MRIYETKARSFLKAIIFRGIEIAIDSLLLSFFIEMHTAIILAFAVEGICFSVHYLFERIWNKIDYGRGLR